MKASIVHVAIVVRDYDEAIDFYTKKLDFILIEDTYQPEQDKRWVVVAPPGSEGTSLLLARASNSRQEAAIGNQAGGRVFLFLNTDNFERDYAKLVSRGVEFVREPRTQDYGIVAVFKDLYGNLWDLLELTSKDVHADDPAGQGGHHERELEMNEPVLKLEQTRRRIECTDSNLAGSTFNDVNLSKAVFKNVSLDGATFSDVRLSNVRISEADFRGASIVESQTDGMTIDGIPVTDLLAAYRATLPRSE